MGARELYIDYTRKERERVGNTKKKKCNEEERTLAHEIEAPWALSLREQQRELSDALSLGVNDASSLCICHFSFHLYAFEFY